ncbi:glycosyl hydrolase family 28-related protein [Nitrospirillum sp. BR 11164]|uniref:glycosyl hydrolase family 28-related protein n=1 Tax=Nitrospirillum sp. BR 11164 TaxID=3104324 RepID=UPI002AFDE32F|nr:glycosyl hydrolase family 28-related protein [Nitrospirillum sp. BR 11164]MEA1649211.1 glycosyl hydrolase family 28-related protein [Nitrospirillum sp. BR 11164]
MKRALVSLIMGAAVAATLFSPSTLAQTGWASGAGALQAKVGGSDAPASVDANGYNGTGSALGVTATGTTTAANLADRFARTINVLDFGADPAGINDSTAAIQHAINAACVTRTKTSPGQIYLPGGSYKTTATITIGCDNVTVAGAGRNVTVIYPTNNGDVFYAYNPSWSPSTPYSYGKNFKDFRIYRADNPSSGAGIHFEHVAIGGATHVDVSGMYVGIEIESSISLNFDDITPGGINTVSGSRLWWVHRSSATDTNPSENFISNTNSRAGSAGGYTYGILIQDTDGFNMANYHVGFTSGPALMVRPEYTSDVIFGLTFSNGGFDTAQYCIYSTGLAGETGGRSSWNFDGVLCELSSLDGFYNDDPNLKYVTAVGSQFFLNGRHGINVSAGTGYKFTGSYFIDNNLLNASGNHVVLSNTAADINLDAASFVRNGSPYAVGYNVAISGSADQISIKNAKYAGAGTADLSNTSSGGNIYYSTIYTDKSSAPNNPGPTTPIANGTALCNISGSVAAPGSCTATQMAQFMGLSYPGGNPSGHSSLIGDGGHFLNFAGSYYGFNLYYNGGWKYADSNGYGAIWGQDSSGNLCMSYAPSGTAGGTPSSVTAGTCLNYGGASIRLPTSTTPSSSSAACAAGSLYWDSNYLYVCTATNTWKRSALGSF